MQPPVSNSADGARSSWSQATSGGTPIYLSTSLPAAVNSSPSSSGTPRRSSFSEGVKDRAPARLILAISTTRRQQSLRRGAAGFRRHRDKARCFAPPAAAASCGSPARPLPAPVPVQFPRPGRIFRFPIKFDALPSRVRLGVWLLAPLLGLEGDD
ncbi:uncharacterized protein A4U43_C08F34250 [Asparagus officinalis]|nr:uncharacterized protein A4U43_C08F34250 [Asparagus officinalis]